MGFFKKKKKDKDNDVADKPSSSSQPPRAEPAAVSKAGPPEGSTDDDPLCLANADGAPAADGRAGARRDVGRQTAALEPATPRGVQEGHNVVCRAVSCLTNIARDTRGLFEEVRPMSEVKTVFCFFATENGQGALTAIADGKLNPHAVASLVVYHLRDVSEPICTKALRESILSAAGLSKGAERLAELRKLCGRLPHQNRQLLASIGTMVTAVAAEHDSCYQDGIVTRMSALGQLFGPLFLRPNSSKFDTEMAASVTFAQDIFSNPSLLSLPISPLMPSSADSTTLSEDDQSGAGVGELQLAPKPAASGAAAAVSAFKALSKGSSAPLVPALKGLPSGAADRTPSSGSELPAACMTKAVTFRAALCEKGGGDYGPGQKPPSPLSPGQRNGPGPAPAAKASRPTSAPSQRSSDAAKGAEGVKAGGIGEAARQEAARTSAATALVDDSDDETNYNLPASADQWVEEVKGLSDEERKTQLQAAMKGGPMLKYSSRGRPPALMFFRLSADTDMLNWAPVTAPENLKYGLVMDQVVRILPGPLASGQFQGAAVRSQGELRLVIVLQEDQKLEIEALNTDALDMWAIALQHVVLARSPADPTMVSPPRIGPHGGCNTHRNWGAPHTARGEQPAGPVVGRLNLPIAAAQHAHGATTSRLLSRVGAQIGPPSRALPLPSSAQHHLAGGASGFATSRAPPTGGGAWGAVPAGPMTARAPGQQGGVAPDLVSMNTHVLLSKARHNRKNEMMALLDDPAKELHPDVTDETGNSVLIIACQNNHKKIVKELLRRSCKVNHQNLKGHTCLHYCFAYKYSSLGEYLISKGADPSIRNRYGFTCFEGLDVERPATTMAAPTAWTSPPAPGDILSPREHQVDSELARLKQRMDALEQENHLLKQGGMTARASALTARRGELESEPDLKAKAFANVLSPRPPAQVPHAQSSPTRPASEVRSCSDSEEDGLPVAEVVEAVVPSNVDARAAHAGEAADIKNKQLVPALRLGAEGGARGGAGKGIVGAAREAFERAASGRSGGEMAAAGIKGDGVGLGSRPPPSAPKPAVLDIAAADAVEGEAVTTPTDCPTQGGSESAMARNSLFPLQTPTVAEAESTVQTGGGKFEKTICASSRAPRSSATSTATSNHAGSDAAGCDPKEGKENLQSAAQPKGSGKAHKHPHIATDSSATTDLNGRPPLNLIRKHENAAQRAAAKKTERGSSAEDDSTDATSEQASSRPSAPPTPSTPAEGYSAVLDSVRAEIVQAEAIMSTVTSTFGVDDDRNRGPAESTLEEKPESASGDERTCSPPTLSRARFSPEAQTGKEQMGQDMLEEGHVDGARERGGEVMDDAVNLVSSGQGGVKEEADLDTNSPGSSLPEYVHAQTKQPAPGKVAVHFARDLISKFEAQSQGQNQHRMGAARAVQGKQKTSVAERKVPPPTATATAGAAALRTSALRSDISDDEGTDVEEDEEKEEEGTILAADTTKPAPAPAHAPVRHGNYQQILANAMKKDQGGADSSDQPGAPQTSKYGVGRSGQSKDPKGEGEAEKRKNKTKTPARGLVKVRGVSGGMQLARSGDWSDSLSEDSDPELKALDKSSSGSDDGSAVPLDETLTLDKLHQSAATAPPDAAGTLGHVMAATEDEVDKKRAFLASLLEGDDEEGSGLLVPPVPMRKTTAKGKVPLYGAEKAANGIASREIVKKPPLDAATPAAKKPPRVSTGTGSAAKKTTGKLTTPSGARALRR